MRIELSLAALLLPMMLFAQENVKVKGRIINQQGEAVEYVQVGVPKRQIGTISTVDGRFELDIPCDTLEFFHVSYQPAAYPVTGPAEDVVIVLHGQELPSAVFIGGDTKEKYLLRPGMTLLKNLGVVTTDLRSGHPSGLELGSVAHAKKPFLVKDILLTVLNNQIPGCVASINVYRIEGKRESFVNVLHRPIYFDVPVSDKPQDFDIRPEETLLLEPGKYFIAFQVVGCDDAALQAFLSKPVEERKLGEMSMDFPILLKSSYIREVALGGMEHVPVNIGVAVKGLEYQ